LRAGSETDSTYWKKFQASAVLDVSFDRAPATPATPGFKSAYPTRACLLNAGCWVVQAWGHASIECDL
jgi:hypothetical protein